eukprot:NODE_6_length_4535_cov_53.112069_g3_i0.p1 GENE.NODE_6_length_4535_cov_53.112069_g3_i0~~NODE_6_length_4535_cov_53.112069_g3_i0.p1  ORF type:complete len:1399 (-),score=256.96 NODE_6_length_4535_cov_53.112069_g3_i0:263-4459(-)
MHPVYFCGVVLLPWAVALCSGSVTQTGAAAAPTKPVSMDSFHIPEYRADPTYLLDRLRAVPVAWPKGVATHILEQSQYTVRANLTSAEVNTSARLSSKRLPDGSYNITIWHMQTFAESDEQEFTAAPDEDILEMLAERDVYETQRWYEGWFEAYCYMAGCLVMPVLLMYPAFIATTSDWSWIGKLKPMLPDPMPRAATAPAVPVAVPPAAEARPNTAPNPRTVQEGQNAPFTPRVETPRGCEEVFARMGIGAAGATRTTDCQTDPIPAAPSAVFSAKEAEPTTGAPPAAAGPRSFVPSPLVKGRLPTRRPFNKRHPHTNCWKGSLLPIPRRGLHRGPNSSKAPAPSSITRHWLKKSRKPTHPSGWVDITPVCVDTGAQCTFDLQPAEVQCMDETPVHAPPSIQHMETQCNPELQTSAVQCDEYPLEGVRHLTGRIASLETCNINLELCNMDLEADLSLSASRMDDMAQENNQLVAENNLLENTITAKNVQILTLREELTTAVTAERTAAAENADQLHARVEDLMQQGHAADSQSAQHWTSVVAPSEAETEGHKDEVTALRNEVKQAEQEITGLVDEIDLADANSTNLVTDLSCQAFLLRRADAVRSTELREAKKALVKLQTPDSNLMESGMQTEPPPPNTDMATVTEELPPSNTDTPTDGSRTSSPTDDGIHVHNPYQPTWWSPDETIEQPSVQDQETQTPPPPQGGYAVPHQQISVAHQDPYHPYFSSEQLQSHYQTNAEFCTVGQCIPCAAPYDAESWAPVVSQIHPTHAGDLPSEETTSSDNSQYTRSDRSSDTACTCGPRAGHWIKNDTPPEVPTVLQFNEANPEPPTGEAYIASEFVEYRIGDPVQMTAEWKDSSCEFANGLRTNDSTLLQQLQEDYRDTPCGCRPDAVCKCRQYMVAAPAGHKCTLCKQGDATCWCPDCGIYYCTRRPKPEPQSRGSAADNADEPAAQPKKGKKNKGTKDNQGCKRHHVIINGSWDYLFQLPKGSDKNRKREVELVQWLTMATTQLLDLIKQEPECPAYVLDDLVQTNGWVSKSIEYVLGDPNCSATRRDVVGRWKVHEFNVLLAILRSYENQRGWLMPTSQLRLLVDVYRRFPEGNMTLMVARHMRWLFEVYLREIRYRPETPNPVTPLLVAGITLRELEGLVTTLAAGFTDPENPNQNSCKVKAKSDIPLLRQQIAEAAAYVNQGRGCPSWPTGCVEPVQEYIGEHARPPYNLSQVIVRNDNLDAFSFPALMDILRSLLGSDEIEHSIVYRIRSANRDQLYMLTARNFNKRHGETGEEFTIRRNNHIDSVEPLVWNAVKHHFPEGNLGASQPKVDAHTLEFMLHVTLSEPVETRKHALAAHFLRVLDGCADVRNVFGGNTVWQKGTGWVAEPDWEAAVAALRHLIAQYES